MRAVTSPRSTSISAATWPGTGKLVDLTCQTPEGQPVPNLVFAAVQFLLFEGTKHELSEYYPSCTNDPRPTKDVFDAFRAFCLEHDTAIRELLATRRVQTNEVRRCAHLLPAFSHVSKATGEQPLSIIEIGTSAGLLLNWDRYRYQYGTLAAGNADSQVLIESAWRAIHTEPLRAAIPSVAHRVGIDLHVVDVQDPREANWLRSLVWPDQASRMQLIDRAIAEFIASPATLLEGDAFDQVPSAIAACPEDTTICLFHCFTLNQLSDERRHEFEQLLSDLSRHRSFWQLSAEWLRTPTAELHCTHWKDGAASRTYLAAIHHHGAWLDWKTKQE